MDFEAGRALVLNLLANKGKAKNSALVRALDGDSDLYDSIREDLIFDDVAADKNGVGLIYLGESISEIQHAEDERLGSTGELQSPVESARSLEADVKLRIFLSYGHDEYAVVAERVKKDLEERGHEVWFDKDQLKAGKDWEAYIDGGLEWASQANEFGRVIFLMTPHSVRRPDGFCLNEIARACDRHMTTIPIMLVEVEPPLSICRIQYLDFRDCVPLIAHEGQYRYRFDRLIEALENNALDIEGGQSRLRKVLNPLSYDTDIRRHLPKFTGRKWLFKIFEDWLAADSNGNKLFWITGPPGVGKTAVASWLCLNRREIAAFHICKFGNSQKSDPRSTVRSLAYQLTTQLPEYFRRLSQLSDIDELCENENAHALFERLIIEPTSYGFPTPDRTIIILIDGLDEATRDGRNELAEFLAQEVDKMPQWMRMVVTSRSDQEVLQPLQGFEQIKMNSNSEENTDDIVQYLRNEMLTSATDNHTSFEEAIQEIVRRSEGIFLYVDWALKDIFNGRLSLEKLDQFPQGLGGFYSQVFHRKFCDVVTYEAEFYPIIAVIAAAQEPIPIDILSMTMVLSKHRIRKALIQLGSLFLIADDDTVRPFHRSIIDWLAAPEKSGVYAVEITQGHRLLASAGWREFCADVRTLPNYFKECLPYHLNAGKETQKLLQCTTDTEFIHQSSELGKLYEIAGFWKVLYVPSILTNCRNSFEKYGRLFKHASCLGRLFLHVGKYEEAISYFNDSLEVSKSTGDANTSGKAHFNLGWCLRHIDEFDEAIKRFETAIGCFEKSHNTVGIARAWSTTGICYWQKQEDVKAIDCLSKALKLFDATTALREQAEACNHLGIVYRSIGMFEDSLAQLEKTKTIYQALSDKKGLGKCYNSLGTAYWWSGNIERAIKCYEDADKLNYQIDQQYIMGLTANNLGYIYLERDELSKAEQEFSRGVSIRQKLGIKSFEMMDKSGLARVFYKRGADSKARQLSQEAIAGLQDYKTVEDLRRAYFNHYIIMKSGDNSDRSEAYMALQRAKEIVEKRLHKVTDEEMRHRLLTRVPVMQEVNDAEMEAGFA